MYDSSHSEYARVGNHSNMILIVRFHSNRTHTPHGSVELAHSRPFSTSTLTYVFELLSAVSKDPDPLARDVRNDGPLRANRPGCCDNYFDTQSPMYYKKGTTFSDHRGILYPPGSSALKKHNFIPNKRDEHHGDRVGQSQTNSQIGTTATAR